MDNGHILIYDHVALANLTGKSFKFRRDSN